MKNIHGRCLCGNIQFSIEPPTDVCGHCHCESCRRSHGSAFVTWSWVPKEKFSIIAGAGSLKWYQSSAWIKWGFCNNCGSSMFYRANKEGHPEAPKTGRIYFTVGNLVDTIDRKPSVHASFEEKAEWWEFNDRLPKHKGKTDEDQLAV